MAGHDQSNEPGERRERRHYRQRQSQSRNRTMRFRASDDEYEKIVAAAAENGVTYSRFIAVVVLREIHGGAPIADLPVRAILKTCMELCRQVRRIGVNLNQAVARLNATGQRSDDLAVCAAVVTRFVERCEDVTQRLDDWLSRH